MTTTGPTTGSAAPAPPVKKPTLRNRVRLRLGRAATSTAASLARKATPGRLALMAVLSLALVAATAVVAAWPPTTGSPDDQHPRGAHGFATSAATLGYEVATLVVDENLVEGLDPHRTLHVVLAREGPMSSSEAASLIQTVRDGRRVLVADTGASAALAHRLGWALSRTPIFSAELGGASPALVPVDLVIADTTHRISVVTPLPLLALEVDPGAQLDGLAVSPLLTTNRTFADLDGNARLDVHDLRGPFTVGLDVRAPSGGRLIYLTSPASFTNALDEQTEVQAMRDALLVELLPDGGSVVFDLRRGPRPTAVDIAQVPVHRAVDAVTCSVCRTLLPSLFTGLGLAALAWRGNALKDWGIHRPGLDRVSLPTGDPEASGAEQDVHADAGGDNSGSSTGESAGDGAGDAGAARRGAPKQDFTRDPS